MMENKRKVRPFVITCTRCGNEFMFSYNKSFFLKDRDSGLEERKQRCPFCNQINLAENDGKFLKLREEEIRRRQNVVRTESDN